MLLALLSVMAALVATFPIWCLVFMNKSVLSCKGDSRTNCVSLINLHAWNLSFFCINLKSKECGGWSLNPRFFFSSGPSWTKIAFILENYFHSSIFACELIDSQYIYQIVMLLLYIVIWYNLQYYSIDCFLPCKINIQQLWQTVFVKLQSSLTV